MTTAAVGFITDGFPAPGLRKTQRLITGHGEDGKGHFLATDAGDHHRIMGEGQAVAVIPYSTTENPVDLNDNVDISAAQENEVGVNSTRENFILASVLVSIRGGEKFFCKKPPDIVFPNPYSQACTSNPAASFE